MFSPVKWHQWIAAVSIFHCPAISCYAQVVLIGYTGEVTNFGPTSSIVDINLMSGEATNPRDTGLFLLAGIAAHPTTGVIYSLTTTPTFGLPNRLVTIDLATGAHTVVGPTGLRIVEGDLAFNPVNGQLYGIQDVGPSGINCNLFSINIFTGSSTVIGDLGSTVLDVSSLAIDQNQTIYAIDSGGTSLSKLLKLNLLTGAIEETTTLSLDLGSGVGMAFHTTTGVAYVSDSGLNGGSFILYILNLDTGELSPIGPTLIPGGINGLTFITVPEPSPLFFVFSALLISWRTFNR